MKDEAFINTILQRGKEAREKVAKDFVGLTAEQLNRQPAPGSWSIAECLQHLVQSHDAFIPVLDKITKGTYKMGFWERYSPFSRMWGRTMKEQLGEQVKRKMKAPKKINPVVRLISSTIVADYQQSLDSFLEYILKCKAVDIDKTIITSPLMSIVTYSLRDAFQFLIQHEHRHISQAIRVKKVI